MLSVRKGAVFDGMRLKGLDTSSMSTFERLVENWHASLTALMVWLLMLRLVTAVVDYTSMAAVIFDVRIFVLVDYIPNYSQVEQVSSL